MDGRGYLRRCREPRLLASFQSVGGCRAGNLIAGHDDGDIVLAATVERLVEQDLGCIAWLIVLAEDPGDRSVIDHLVQAVAAKQAAGPRRPGGASGCRP